MVTNIMQPHLNWEQTMRAAGALLQTGMTLGEEALREARFLALNTVGGDLSDWLSLRYQTPHIMQRKRFAELIERRISGEPCDHICGKKAFWRSEFVITREVLTPRWDSEVIIELALQIYQRQPPKILVDIGVGSGCLLLSLLQEWPGCYGLGVDLSWAACELAKINAQHLALENRVAIIQGSWHAAVASKSADLIISNPPYIVQSRLADLAPEVRDYDPVVALDGGADGLACYRQILKDLARVVKREAWVILEVGYDQKETVDTLIRQEIFCQGHGKSIIWGTDIQGIDRAVAFRMP